MNDYEVVRGYELVVVEGHYLQLIHAEEVFEDEEWGELQRRAQERERWMSEIERRLSEQEELLRLPPLRQASAPCALQPTPPRSAPPIVRGRRPLRLPPVV